ncbi:hypothetical protein NMG60_11008569 [Bertholletia excelsa]
MERSGWKPNVEISPNCPRCGSCNTKFCYYNNYSLTQPRYFCKGCRRYWTKGGSLRNVPVGGGCRKSRRGKSIRISNEHHRGPSRNFQGHGGDPAAGSSAVTSGGSPGIDLAQVYANFLNPTRESETRIHVPEMPSGGWCSQPETHDFGGHLPFQNGLVSEAHICGEAGYFYGLGSVQKEGESGAIREFGGEGMIGGDHGLPPLPGEEVGWPDSQVMLPDPDHLLHGLQLGEIDPQVQNPGLELVGNKGDPFEVPSYGAFFRP